MFHHPYKVPQWREIWLSQTSTNKNLTKSERSKYAKEPKKCLLEEVIFKNIRIAYFSFHLLSPCSMKKVRFLEMNNIYFDDDDFSLTNSKNIEIKYCNFNYIKNAFLFSKVDEVSIEMY